MKTTLFSSLHSPVSITSDNLLKSGKSVMERDLGNSNGEGRMSSSFNESGGRRQGAEH